MRDALPQPDEPSTESLPSRMGSVWSLGALALVVGLGVWLRLPVMRLGFSPDEIANVSTATARQIFEDPETGVNPPLMRWLFNLPFDPWDGANFARWWSFGWSLAGIALAFVVARRASKGHAWVGLAAAALMAVHPWNVHYAGIFRIYAWWSGMLLLFVWCLSRAMEASERRAMWRWGGAALATGMLLPWIHYFSVPVLGVMGCVVLLMRGKRRWFAVFVAAALGCIPLIPKVLFDGARRVSPDRAPLSDSLLRMGSLDLHPGGLLWFPASRGWNAVTGDWPDQGWSMAAVLLLSLAAMALSWRRLPITGRLALGSALGVFVGLLTLGQLQYVRPAAVVMATAAMAPCVFVAPALWGPRWLQGVALALGTVWVLGSVPSRLASERAKWASEEGGPIFAADPHAFDAQRGDRPVYVHPKHRMWTVWFHLAHQEPRKAPRGPKCEGRRDCFEHDGIAYLGVDKVDDGAVLRGLLLHLDAWRPDGFAAACAPLHDTGTWGLWDCPSTP